MARDDDLEGMSPLIREHIIKQRDMLESGEIKWYYPDSYEEENSYIPVGCRACGGDYPRCKQGCPLFDDQTMSMKALWNYAQYLKLVDDNFPMTKHVECVYLMSKKKVEQLLNPLKSTGFIIFGIQQSLLIR